MPLESSLELASLLKGPTQSFGEQTTRRQEAQGDREHKPFFF